VSVATATEAEDALVELLSGVFGVPAAVYADVETGATTANVYVSKAAVAQVSAVRAGLRVMRESGLDIGPGRCRVRRIKREDWAESWKRHFRALEIGPRLLIKPSWITRKPQPGQAVVVLDPGLSFGTGNHPTTSFCLERIAALRRDDESQSLLDAGCGSGILAISAVKLGYRPVEAFDFDPEAVRVARENAAANNVAPRISRRDLTRMPLRSSKKFDVVCANLVYDLLVAEREKLVNRLAPRGTLILAGILKEQFAAVERAFAGLGLDPAAERSRGEWKSGAWRRSRPRQ